MNDNDPTVAFSLTVKNGGAALDFYRRALGAEELYRMPTPDGGIAHAEIRIGNTKVYLSDEAPEWHARAMPEGGQASCLFSVNADSCDAAFQRAVEAGGTPLSEPADQFWGSRSAMIVDPFGYRWSFCQAIEEVSPDEMERRAQAFFAG